MTRRSDGLAFFATGCRRGGALAIILFAVVVLGISVFLVRARPTLSSAVAAPSMLGDAAALTLAPIVRAPRLPEGDLRPTRVALLHDAASAAFHEDVERHERDLEAWAAMISATGAEVHGVDPAGAERDSSDVLVVVASPCLSAPARRAMRTAASRGSGVIFTGLTGHRDGGCRVVGFGLLAELAGASRADTIPSTAEQYVTVLSGSPLTVDVPPGARLELKPAPNVAVRHQGRNAYYSDRDLNPVTHGDMSLVDGALLHDATDGRRVAYFGFELGTLVERQWEQSIMQLLVRNAVAFAAGRSLAGPDPWPSGFDAAAVIAQDVEDEFGNAQEALDTLRAVGVPGTFFVVSDLARGFEDLTRTLASAGEVGSHTENHARLGGPDELQRERLSKTQRDLTSILGHPVTGMRPPEEQFDEATLLAWKAAGGTYVFGATDGRSASPELVRIGDEPFVLIGRVVDDDYLTVRRANIVDPARLAADQIHAFEKVRALGGLFIMSYHSNMLARTKTVGAVGIVARTLKADRGVWLTTTGAASDWWLARHRLVTTVARAGNGSLALTVRNDGPTASLATGVTVTLPNGATIVEAAGGELLKSRAGTARVLIPALGPGTSHSVQLIPRGALNAP